MKNGITHTSIQPIIDLVRQSALCAYKAQGLLKEESAIAQCPRCACQFGTMTREAMRAHLALCTGARYVAPAFSTDDREMAMQGESLRIAMLRNIGIARRERFTFDGYRNE